MIKPELYIFRFGHEYVVSARLVFDDHSEALKFNNVIVDYLLPILEQQKLEDAKMDYKLVRPAVCGGASYANHLNK